MQIFLAELEANIHTQEHSVELLQDRYHIARSIFILAHHGIGKELFCSFPLSPTMIQTIVNEGMRAEMPEYIILPIILAPQIEALEPSNSSFVSLTGDSAIFSGLDQSSI